MKTGYRKVEVELPPHTSIVFVPDDQPYRVWSEPVHMMFEPARDRQPDVVELTMKPYVPPEHEQF